MLILGNLVFAKTYFHEIKRRFFASPFFLNLAGVTMKIQQYSTKIEIDSQGLNIHVLSHVFGLCGFFREKVQFFKSHLLVV